MFKHNLIIKNQEKIMATLQDIQSAQVQETNAINQLTMAVSHLVDRVRQLEANTIDETIAQSVVDSITNNITTINTSISTIPGQ